MAGAQTAITIEDARAQAALAGVGLLLGHPAAMMGEIAGYLLTATQLRFEREAGPDGKRWKPLAARTARARRGKGRRGYDHILRDQVSPGLYGSLTQRSDDETAVVGTNLKYAAIHQFGGDVEMHARSQRLYFNYDAKRDEFKGFAKKRKATFERWVTIGAHTIHIPARPYLGINDDDLTEIGAIVSDALDKAAAS